MNCLWDTGNSSDRQKSFRAAPTGTVRDQLTANCKKPAFILRYCGRESFKDETQIESHKGNVQFQLIGIKFFPFTWKL